MTTVTDNTIQPFDVYHLGTINNSQQYPTINLKDKTKKHTYLILDVLNNRYFKTTSIGGIKRWITSHYGQHIDIVTSNKLYYIPCSQFEQLLPDTITVTNNYGLVAKIQLKVNLKYRELQNILEKEGIDL